MKRVYRLSARWMNDHLDCWPPEKEPAPVGVWKGHFWVGELTDEQVLEVKERAQFYVDPWGPDSDCELIKRSAKLVLAAIEKAEKVQSSNIRGRR